MSGWRGWYFNGEKLYAPDLRDGFTVADVRRIWWDRYLINDLCRQLGREPLEEARGRPVVRCL